MAQKRDLDPYAGIRDKLKPALLALDSVQNALAGLQPDAAVRALCHCIGVEQQERRIKERRTLIVLGVLMGLWIWMNAAAGCLQQVGLLIFLLGPFLIAIGIWLSVRRYQPLRHNALAGMAPLLTEIRDTELVEPICEVARTLDGQRRSWERDLEVAMLLQIGRLLARLSGAEAAALSAETRAFLRERVLRQAPTEFIVAALLTLGAGRDHLTRPVAEKLTRHGDERIREAAAECLKDLG